jgi:8-oxo-dGTP pyrophosphatase MutT (NUDIX family)
VIEPWKKRERRVDYDCGFFKVHLDYSASPITGKEYPFYVLSTRDWVNMIALTPEKKVIMVSQFRHGSGEISLEIPGGAVDAKETALDGAKRELREETGYESSEWHLLGSVRPNPAILSNTCHFHLALNAKKVSDLHLDEAEELEVSLHDLREIPGMIKKEHIRHSLVVAAFYYLDLFKQENPGKI